MLRKNLKNAGNAYRWNDTLDAVSCASGCGVRDSTMDSGGNRIASTQERLGPLCRRSRKNNADPGLVAVLDNIRSLERNPLMHPEDWLDVDEAIAVFTLSNTAITRLISDLRKKKPPATP